MAPAGAGHGHFHSHNYEVVKEGSGDSQLVRYCVVTMFLGRPGTEEEKKKPWERSKHEAGNPRTKGRVLKEPSAQFGISHSFDIVVPPPPMFNPLATKAATICLSVFGPGGPFSFDAWKKQQRKSNSSKKDSTSKGGNSNHEALGNEWLQSGRCPIAKSYRAVSSVIPLVAKVLQPPPGMKLKCPPAIVAARAALSQTAFAKNLRPQPLPAKVLVIGSMGMAANVPLGICREHTKKFSLSWFAAVHAAVPFIAILRKSVLMPKSAMAFTIATSVLGQVIGSRAERYRLKAAASKTLPLTIETSVGGVVE
ncbi:hypothetical protein ACFX1X_036597 [Malus domestica]